MFCSDIKNTPPLRKYRRSAGNNPQKLRRIQQKQQESFSNYASYFYFLIKQNLHAIERLISQLQQDARLHDNLIKNLKRFMMGQITTFYAIPQVVIKDLLSILKERIQMSKKNLNEDETSFYQSVLKDNIRVSQSIKKQWNIIQEWTIQKLYYLDILSIFFRMGLTFLERCNCRVIPITKEVISYLFGFSNNEAAKLLKIYRDSHKFLREIENTRIQQMVDIYHLLLIRNRLYFIVIRAGRKTIDQTQYSRQPNYPRKLFQEDIQFTQQTQYTQCYNFCQVPFWSAQQNIQQLPVAKRFEIIRQLQDENKQKDSKILFNAILLIKIRKNLSFDSIFKVQNLFAKNQLEKIKKLVYEFTQSKTAELAAKLPYIFIKDDTFDVAFEKSGLSKKYDLKHFDKLFASKMGVVFTFVRAAFKKSRQLMVNLDTMLKCQLNHKRELIVIKKFVISFGQIAGISKENARPQHQSLVCNLILITSQNRILSSCIVRDPIKDQKYIRILKRIIKTIQFKPESVILLYQNQPGRVPQQRSFYRFYFHILKDYHLRLYVINSPQYCKLALLVFSYIKMQILSRRQSITVQNFYEIAESQITSNLNILSSIVFPY